MIIFSVFPISIFLSLLIIGKKQTIKKQIFLLIYLLLNGIIFLILFMTFMFKSSDLVIFVIYSNQLLMPLIFLYVFSMLKIHIQKKNIYFLFSPLLISLLFLIVSSLIYSEDQLYVLFETDLFTAPIFYKITLIIENIFPPLILIYLLKKSYSYKKMLKDNYSFLTGVELKWIRTFLYMELTAWLCYVISNNILYYLYPAEDNIFLRISIAAMALIFFYMAYYSISYTGIFNHYEIYDKALLKTLLKNDTYKSSFIPAETAEEIKNKILISMEKEKLYRDPYLSLSGLSEITGVTTHNLSNILNNNLKTSFYDFINGYRVEDMKYRIDRGEVESKTLLALAMDSGFNSKATFNRSFKKITGYTPSSYIKFVSSDPMSRK